MFVQVHSPHMHLINVDHVTDISINYKSHGKYAVVAIVNGTERTLEVCSTESDAIAWLESLWSTLPP